MIRVLLAVLMLCAPVVAQDFTMGIRDMEIRFDPGDGLGVGASSLAIRSTDGSDRATTGFTASVANDPTLLFPFNVVAAPAVAALKGGAGPDFFAPQLFPDGYTIAVLYDFLLAETLTFGLVHTEVVTADYSLTGSLVGVINPVQTFLVLGFLGDPPVPNEVLDTGNPPTPNVVLDDVITPYSGQVDLIGATLIQRGDLNGDFGMTLVDPVLALGNLFNGVVLSCEDACDVNDSGALNINDPVHMLTNLFANGPPPAEPFQLCGVDVTGDDLTCEVGFCP